MKASPFSLLLACLLIALGWVVFNEQATTSRRLVQQQRQIEQLSREVAELRQGRIRP